MPKPIVKFIHAADLHIDSSLRGLSQYPGAPCQALQTPTRDAFANLIDLAIRESVDFVVIAGDLFDGEWKDMGTGLWTAEQFRRLERASIQVFLLRGNHDALSQVRQAISWPKNVREFSVESPESFVLEDLGVALHGQGFARRASTDDLAATYPRALPGYFNLGVLHTSLTGDIDHDTYAPTSEDVLTARGYDYWALGHIHAHRVIRQQPYIAYSGNTQGRFWKESGPKGCLLGTLNHGRLEHVEFCGTDTLRWHNVSVRLQATDGMLELYEAVESAIRENHALGDGRYSAIRVAVGGPCAVHRSLMTGNARDQLLAEIRNRANELEGRVWLEKLFLETSPPADLEALRLGNDLMGELLRSIRDIGADEEQLQLLAQELQVLGEPWALELEGAGIDLRDSAQLRRWLGESESALVAQLCEVDS